ncbi:MAG: RidA family protein [Rhodospirillales bacterium]|jgi:2-iminobutanoate/2-iminopropanoate deaminase
MTIVRHGQTPIMHRAVAHGGTLYLGGIVAEDFTLDMEGQTAQVCRKIDAVLASAGSDRSRLLAATIYITDMSMKDKMNAAWTAWLAPDQRPTRATIGVADLGKGVLIEIVVTAAA